jgi:hypothetical protein
VEEICSLTWNPKHDEGLVFFTLKVLSLAEMKASVCEQKNPCNIPELGLNPELFRLVQCLLLKPPSLSVALNFESGALS